MEKKVLAFLFGVFLMLQFVSAVDTEIKITTYPNHDVRLEFINPNAVAEKESSLMDLQRLNSGDSGEISYTLSTSKDVFNVNYALSVDGEKLLSGKVKDVTSGETLKMVLLKGSEEITKNYQVIDEEVEETEENISEENLSAETLAGETEQEETETESSEENSESFFSKINPVKLWSALKFSGLATDEQEESNNNPVYGIVAFFLLVLVFAFVIARKYKKKMHVDSSSKFKSDDDEIADAEKRIGEARKEIDDIRGKKGREFLDKKIDELGSE